MEASSYKKTLDIVVMRCSINKPLDILVMPVSNSSQQWLYHNPQLISTQIGTLSINNPLIP